MIPEGTRAYVSSLCAAGERVRFEEYDGVNHGFAAYASLPSMLEWLTDVQSGEPVSNCAS